MTDDPVALLTRTITAVFRGVVIDFDALRAQLRAEPEVILVHLTDRPDLIALDPVEAFVEVVNVLDRTNDPDAASVALLEVLTRFEGAFGSLVPRRAPFVRWRHEAAGWPPMAVVQWVETLIEDAMAGYPVNDELVDAEDRRLVEELGREVAKLPEVPARVKRLAAEMPSVITLLIATGPEAADGRLAELAEASRAGCFD